MFGWDVLSSEMNEMPCRPPRQRVLIADDAASAVAEAADGDDVAVLSITTDIDLSDHPLGISP